jgi:hypothetical protein
LDLSALLEYLVIEDLQEQMVMQEQLAPKVEMVEMVLQEEMVLMACLDQPACQDQWVELDPKVPVELKDLPGLMASPGLVVYLEIKVDQVPKDLQEKMELRVLLDKKDHVAHLEILERMD